MNEVRRIETVDQELECLKGTLEETVKRIREIEENRITYGRVRFDRYRWARSETDTEGERNPWAVYINPIFSELCGLSTYGWTPMILGTEKELLIDHLNIFIRDLLKLRDRLQREQDRIFAQGKVAE